MTQISEIQQRGLIHLGSQIMDVVANTTAEAETYGFGISTVSDHHDLSSLFEDEPLFVFEEKKDRASETPKVSLRPRIKDMKKTRSHVTMPFSRSCPRKTDGRLVLKYAVGNWIEDLTVFGCIEPHPGPDQGPTPAAVGWKLLRYARRVAELELAIREAPSHALGLEYHVMMLDLTRQHRQWVRDLTEEGIEPNPGPPNDRRCFNCDQPGHLANACPQPRKPNAGPKGGMKANQPRRAKPDLNNNNNAVASDLAREADKIAGDIDALVAKAIDDIFPDGIEKSTGPPLPTAADKKIALEEAEKAAAAAKKAAEYEKYVTAVQNCARDFNISVPVKPQYWWVVYLFWIVSLSISAFVMRLPFVFRHIVLASFRAIPYIGWVFESFTNSMITAFCCGVFGHVAKYLIDSYLNFVIWRSMADSTYVPNIWMCERAERASAFVKDYFMFSGNLVYYSFLVIGIPRMLISGFRRRLFKFHSTNNPFVALSRRSSRHFEVLSPLSKTDFEMAHDGRLVGHKFTDVKVMPLYVDVQVTDLSTIRRLFCPTVVVHRVSISLITELLNPSIVSPLYEPVVVKKRMLEKCARAPEINFWSDVYLNQRSVHNDTAGMAFAVYLRNRHMDRDSALHMEGF